MKINLAALLAFCVLGSGLLKAEEDYAARFKALNEQKVHSKIEPLLEEWRAKEPKNPDAWVTSANYYFNQSLAPTISTKPAEKGGFALKNSKTGKASGSVSFKPETERSDKAVKLLQEATTRFPDRLDIWCGLAYLYQETAQFEPEFAVLKEMVTYAAKNHSDLKWVKGAPIAEPWDQFLPKKLHQYGAYYQKKETPADDKRFLKIAEFAVEQFPNHPYAYNDVARFHSINGDHKKTREWLEKANKADPTDALVMLNLGVTCMELGDQEAAKKWCNEVIRRDPEGKYAEPAKETLAKLGKK